MIYHVTLDFLKERIKIEQNVILDFILCGQIWSCCILESMIWSLTFLRKGWNWFFTLTLSLVCS